MGQPPVAARGLWIAEGNWPGEQAIWALLAGIGKAIAQRLAKQGLNVVLVALQDDLLDATHAELAAEYPALQFRKARAVCRGARPCRWQRVAAAEGAGLEPRGQTGLPNSGGDIPRPTPKPQIGANLGKPGYMEDIAKGTADINVQVVFCNAGYILSGFFYTRCVSVALGGGGAPFTGDMFFNAGYMLSSFLYTR